MLRVKPGDCVLYCDPRGAQVRPPWPAVICQYDMIPLSVRRKRGYDSDVALLLLHRQEVRWAESSNIRPFDIQVWQNNTHKHTGLREAYRQAVNAIADRLPLSYWKIVIAMQYERDIATDPEPQAEPCQLIESVRQDLPQVIQEPVADKSARKRPTQNEDPDQTHCTAADSHFKKQRTSLERPRASLPIRRCGTIDRTADGETLLESDISCSENSITASTQDKNIDTETTRRFNTGSSYSLNVRDQLLHPYLLASEDKEDEDEIADSALACWLIGPEAEKFYIPKSAVTDREHLRKMKAHLMQPNENSKGWTVFQPKFQDIDPVQFRPVAEFLSSGDFKTPTHGQDGEPLDPDGYRLEALQVCAGAWKVAEDLSLNDLMGHILTKVKNLGRLPFEEALLFAQYVYQATACDEFEVDEEKAMREYLVSILKEHTGEDMLGNAMRRYPELGRDVHRALADDYQNANDEDQEDEAGSDEE